MKINILGTGDAITLTNYNTCFTDESKKYFNGNIFVPDDLEDFEIL